MQVVANYHRGFILNIADAISSGDLQGARDRSNDFTVKQDQNLSLVSIDKLRSMI